MGQEETVFGDGWVSDDSSFYGDECEQDRLETFCEEFRPVNAWSTRKHDLNGIAFKYRNVPPPKLSNPGEGQLVSWHLGETAEDFVKRLPPVTTSASDCEWIWVHNPYPEDHGGSKVTNVLDFTVRGQGLLARSLRTRRDIEANGQSKNRSVIARHLHEESNFLHQRITELAVESNVVCGKWMLFPSLEDLTRIWRLVVDGVISNRLGPTAKVAPDQGKAGERLVCIYTKDFRDKDDVLRVLRELVSMGVVTQRNKPVYYKPDAYTYLDIYKASAAEYGLQASVYSSQKLLAEEKPQQAVLSPRTQSSLNRFVKTVPE
ncbi:uncharacterized protein N0V89_010871 [Didymosphaeria variabile]|uniref:DUF1917-domain-containing protein n=1 Tax=Didymosphaeria variabile TaxID=1932322 RepID=A0A9W8XCF8_9PLEO|nr:uncharacterized protein N0V89_010871 [Didymosphaeria variabile]KAJ4346938.1 hypothetical protein N0V89_010871 [Didymosphaeria variabile]